MPNAIGTCAQEGCSPGRCVRLCGVPDLEHGGQAAHSSSKSYDVNSKWVLLFLMAGRLPAGSLMIGVGFGRAKHYRGSNSCVTSRHAIVAVVTTAARS